MPSGGIRSFRESAGEAIRSALREVNPSADSSYLPCERHARKGREDSEVRARRICRVAGRTAGLVSGGQSVRASWAFYVPEADGSMYYRPWWMRKRAQS